MNAFDYIEELRQCIVSNASSCDLNETITKKEHFSGLLNTLDILKEELKNVEYVYKFIPKYGTPVMYNDMLITQSDLSNELLVMQPINTDNDTYRYADIDNLAKTLSQLRDQGKIDKDILLLPPEIIAMSAILKPGSEQAVEDKEE